MLDSIRVFLKVIELGSFSKAGDTLRMAPSSIARHIDRLEKDLGVVLLKRSTRSLVLTQEGETLLWRAKRLVHDADTLKRVFSQPSPEPQGFLAVSSIESFGHQQICPIIPEFLRRFPKIVLDMQLEPKMVNLISEEVDIAIRIGRPTDSGLRYRKLLSNKTVICASPDYIAEFGKPKTPEDLLQHNCLTLRRNRQTCYWYFHGSDGVSKIAVEGSLGSRGGSPILEMVLQGGGIAHLPYWMVSRHIKQKNLIRCLGNWSSSLYQDGSGEVYIVYRDSQYIKPSIRAFIDFLVESLSTEEMI